MDTLERLVAIKDIEDLIARYAISFDDKDWSTFATLWTVDAVFEVEGTGAFVGRDELLRFLTTCLPADYSGKHMNSPPLVELAPDGQSAIARTDVVWIPHNFANQIVGRYTDEVVKQDGRWLFRRRSETPVDFRPGPPPMSDDAVRVSGATMPPAAVEEVGRGSVPDQPPRPL